MYHCTPLQLDHEYVPSYKRRRSTLISSDSSCHPGVCTPAADWQSDSGLSLVGSVLSSETRSLVRSPPKPQPAHLPPTPPCTPDSEKSLEDLPDWVLRRMFAYALWAPEDRVTLQLVSRRIRQSVLHAFPDVRRLRFALTERQDDRASSEWVVRTVGRCSGLRSLTLCLNSSIHESLCDSPLLFRRLAGGCPSLREFTLLLVQLHQRHLDQGLTLMAGQTSQGGRLRKLCLVNSAAGATTLDTIARCFPDLESLGLMNCMYVRDDALTNLLTKCVKLRTLNVRASKRVTHASVNVFLANVARRFDAKATSYSAKDTIINPPTPATAIEDISWTMAKLYIAHSAVDRAQLRLPPHVAIRDVDDERWAKIDKQPTRTINCRKRGRTQTEGSAINCLDDSAVRPSWEYDSDTDF